MKIQNPKYRWVIDAILLTSFLLTYFTRITGLSLHQLLGVFVGLFSAYHLLIHWDWVTSVIARLGMKTSTKSRLYFVLDLGIFAGLFIIIVTGLVISSWLNLALANYGSWLRIHIVTSLATLALLACKIVVHRQWIALTARKMFARPASAVAPAASMAATTGQAPMSRREFLRVAVPAGALTLAAAGMAVKGLTRLSHDASASSSPYAYAQDLSTPTASASSTAQATSSTESTVSAAAQPTSAAATQAAAVPSDSVNACTVRCNRKCSFPGRCKRYTDSNSNNRCDLGECL